MVAEQTYTGKASQKEGSAIENAHRTSSWSISYHGGYDYAHDSTCRVVNFSRFTRFETSVKTFTSHKRSLFADTSNYIFNRFTRNIFCIVTMCILCICNVRFIGRENK